MAPKRKASPSPSASASASASASPSASAAAEKPKRAKKNPKSQPVDETFTRVTRSLAKQDSRLARSIAKVETPPKKKAKGKAKVVGSASPGGGDKKKNTKKKAKVMKEEEEVKEKEEEEEENDDVKEEESKEMGKTVIVEYCKQCSSFKNRAMQVQEGLKKAVPEITVLLNPDNPRRGCFEIREDGGEKFISLLDMKRPFKPMKDLDMEKVISDLIEKIKS